MSELVSDNFSAQKTDPNRIVRPCFCCDMKYETFYNFINIWDIIGISMGITGSIVEMNQGRVLSGTSLFLNIVSLIMVIIAYVIYYNQKNYGLFIHKFYSITRLIFACVEIVMIIIIFILMTFIKLPRNLSHLRALFIVGIIGIQIFLGVNLYWSILLMKVVNRRGRTNLSEIIQEEDNEDEENDPSVNENPSASKKKKTFLKIKILK